MISHQFVVASQVNPKVLVTCGDVTVTVSNFPPHFPNLKPQVSSEI